MRSIINNPYDAKAIAEAYFYNMSKQSTEWEFTDLQDEFADFYEKAKAEAERCDLSGY